MGHGLWGVPEELEPKEEARATGRAGHPGWSCWLAQELGGTRFLALYPQGTALHASCLCELGEDGLVDASLALGAGAPQPVTRMRGGAGQGENAWKTGACCLCCRPRG